MPLCFPLWFEMGAKLPHTAIVLGAKQKVILIFLKYVCLNSRVERKFFNLDHQQLLHRVLHPILILHL